LKWFKHLSDSHNDPDLSVAWDKFGDAGIIVFWVTMEMYAKEFEHLDKKGDGFLKIGLKNYRRTLRKTFIKVESILNFYQKKSRIFFKIEGDYILLKIPKFIELSDNYSRLRDFRKKHNDNKMITPRLHIEVEVDKEVDKDLKKEVKKEVYSQTSDEVRLTNLLFSLIRKRNTNWKKEVFTEKQVNTLIQKWAVHIDRLIRLNERTPERIEEIIKWCQEDDFWQNNILSTEKLRKQFDQLEIKADKEVEKSSPKPQSKLPKFNEDTEFCCSICKQVKLKKHRAYDGDMQVCDVCSPRNRGQKESKEKISNVVTDLSNKLGVK